MKVKDLYTKLATMNMDADVVIDCSDFYWAGNLHEGDLGEPVVILEVMGSYSDKD